MTRSPRARSAWLTWQPMKPAAPVTRTAMPAPLLQNGVLFSRRAPGCPCRLLVPTARRSSQSSGTGLAAGAMVMLGGLTNPFAASQDAFGDAGRSDRDAVGQGCRGREFPRRLLAIARDTPTPCRALLCLRPRHR